jgi:DNA (cytosine-5)-methyltransferase 1
MRPLRLGTDCSGIEAPSVALRALGVPFEHVFASEVDAACVATLRHPSHAPGPRLLYGDPDGPCPDGDVLRRDPVTVPEVDLYVCGFPCQPFSRVGSRHGLRDARGTVFEACVAYVRAARPRVFVLENVRHLLHIDGGATWAHILGEVTSIPGYAVSWQVLDTKEYGLAQSRRRVYVVGVRDADAPFVFPPATTVAPTVGPWVDRGDATPPRDTPQTRVALALAPLLEQRAGVFVDTLQYRSAERVPARGFGGVATCVLASSYMWCVPMRRWATRGELLRLQGFPADYHVAGSDKAFRRQVGNAMSVCVLEAVLGKLWREGRWSDKGQTVGGAVVL